MKMIDAELQRRLIEPFPPEDHLDRPLPGGNRWFYIKWQKIRSRLHQACPDWEVAYSDPIIAGDMTVIRCRITIAGVTREGIGNSASYPDKKAYGSPIELARADAFKEAAEMFGVAAYLDDQEYVVKYLHKHNDGRAYRYYTENKERDAGVRGRKNTPLVKKS